MRSRLIQLACLGIVLGLAMLNSLAALHWSHFGEWFRMFFNGGAAIICFVLAAKILRIIQDADEV